MYFKFNVQKNLLGASYYTFFKKRNPFGASPRTWPFLHPLHLSLPVVHRAPQDHHPTLGYSPRTWPSFTHCTSPFLWSTEHLRITIPPSATHPGPDHPSPICTSPFLWSTEHFRITIPPSATHPGPDHPSPIAPFPSCGPPSTSGSPSHPRATHPGPDHPSPTAPLPSCGPPSTSGSPSHPRLLTQDLTILHPLHLSLPVVHRAPQDHHPTLSYSPRTWPSFTHCTSPFLWSTEHLRITIPPSATHPGPDHPSPTAPLPSCGPPSTSGSPSHPQLLTQDLTILHPLHLSLPVVHRALQDHHPTLSYSPRTWPSFTHCTSPFLWSTKHLRITALPSLSYSPGPDHPSPTAPLPSCGPPSTSGSPSHPRLLTQDLTILHPLHLSLPVVHRAPQDHHPTLGYSPRTWPSFTHCTSPFLWSTEHLRITIPPSATHPGPDHPSPTAPLPSCGPPSTSGSPFHLRLLPCPSEPPGNSAAVLRALQINRKQEM